MFNVKFNHKYEPLWVSGPLRSATRCYHKIRLQSLRLFSRFAAFLTLIRKLKSAKPQAALTVLFMCFMTFNPLVGCGGGLTSATEITAAQVFTAAMVGQTWTFQNGYGDTTVIRIEQAPAEGAAGFTGNNVVFHYTKSNTRAYWNPGTPDAELWFVLHEQLDGSWSSTASLINFPESCGFCTDPPNWKTLTSNVRPVSGKPIPYGIIPASASRVKILVDTAYQSYTLFDRPEPDFSEVPLAQPSGNGPGTPWRNIFYVEDVATPVYSGPAMVSEQWEGPCFPTMLAGCAHEKWYFAPGLGLVKVIPLNIGAGDNADPMLIMQRIT